MGWKGKPPWLWPCWLPAAAPEVSTRRKPANTNTNIPDTAWNLNSSSEGWDICFCFHETTILSSPVDLSRVRILGFTTQPHGCTQPPASAEPLLGACSVFPGGSRSPLWGQGDHSRLYLRQMKKANSKLCEMTLGDNNLQQMSWLFNVWLTKEPSEIINTNMSLLVKQITFRYYFTWISPQYNTISFAQKWCPFSPCKGKETN